MQLISLITLFAVLARLTAAVPVAAEVAEIEARQYDWGAALSSYRATRYGSGATSTPVATSAPPTSTGGTRPPTTIPAGCTAYELISARGTTESQTSPRGNAGFVRGVLAAVPGGKNYEVVYPAVADFANGPRQGAADLLSHVKSRLQSCPDMKFVLIGYSQGAMVVVTAENNSDLPVNSVIATVLYGNPYWGAGRPENAQGSGLATTGGSRAGTKTPAAYQGKTLDICIQGDGVCQSGGVITAAHLQYPGSSFEKTAIDFAVAKLRAAGF